MTMILPKEQRDTIAAVAHDAARTVNDRPVPGLSKFHMATALGMRKLKTMGMPAALTNAIGPALDPTTEDEDPDEAGLTQDEKTIVDGIANVAGAGVGLIADKIEDDTGCECNRQILALIRYGLQVGIETAVRGIKTSTA